jgi:hypothetical protein
LISIGHTEQMKITKIEESPERHPGQRRDRLEHLDERIECLAHQRRHADEKADRDRDRDGDEIADHHPRDRIGELDADALVVRPVVIERTLEVLPQLGADVERTGHRRFALGRGRAHELGVFRVHLRDRPGAARGDVPCQHECDEQRDRDDGRAQSQR